MVEQIFTALTNSKLTFDFGATPAMTKRLRGLGTILAYYMVTLKHENPHAKFQVILFNNLRDLYTRFSNIVNNLTSYTVSFLI